MIVVEIARQNSSKVSFASDDDVVEAFAADGANQAFHVWRLPGAPGRDENLFDAHIMYPIAELAAVDSVAVSQEVSGCFIPRKGLDDLLGLVQWFRKRFRCHAMTVSGFTNTSVSRQPAHLLASQTHRILSAGFSRGRRGVR